MTTALIIAEAVAIILLGVLVAGLLRSHAEVLRALHDLRAAPPESSPVPGTADRVAGGPVADLEGPSPWGDDLVVAVAEPDTLTLLVFLSSTCVTCRGLWAALGDRRGPRLPGDPRVVVVTEDADLERVPRLRELAPRGAPVIMSSAAWSAYGVARAPHVALVDGRSRRVRAEGSPESWDGLVAWLTHALHAAPGPSR